MRTPEFIPVQPEQWDPGTVTVTYTYPYEQLPKQKADIRKCMRLNPKFLVKLKG